MKKYLFVNHEIKTRYFEYLLLFCEEVLFRTSRVRNKVFRVFSVIMWSTFSYTTRKKQGISSICVYSVKKYLFWTTSQKLSICCYSVKRYLLLRHEIETRYFEYLLLFCEEVTFRTPRDRNRVFRVFAVTMWRSTFSYTTRQKQSISSICCYSVKS